jgi:alkanesulfonate monooxygenase SsuD/methylene tetrahydromethanopterin reductase-like flavin-dependent oxidoreductase (luciferase family)
MAHDITVGATRGRRMDEALTALRPLVAGSEVTMPGDFFTLDRVRILPPPAPAVPIVIGGCSLALLCDFVLASSAVTRSRANSRAGHRSSRDRDRVTGANRHRTFGKFII